MTEQHTELLPWMTREYEHLARLADNGKLAHAYLFGGQQGVGKLTLARHFAHYLLCSQSKEHQPCNECRECQLLAAGTHPDLKLIRPEDSSEIKIEQIRSTIDFLTRTSQRGGYKIVIFSPAEAMNINSANALLKVLEEPSAKTLLILISHQPGLLMATIRSRCHTINFNRPSPEQVIPWLEAKNVRGAAAELLRMASNIPYRALELADDDAVHDRTVLHSVMEKLLKGHMDIAEAAAECDQFSLENNIEGMMLCTVDILASSQGGAEDRKSSLHDHDLESLAEFFRDRTKLKALHEFYLNLQTARRAAGSGTNPNALLMLESLFHCWVTISR